MFVFNLPILRQVFMAWLLYGLDRRIRRFGHTALSIGRYGSDCIWAYSLGFMETYGHPEVIAFDMPPNIANSAFWRVAERLKAGEVFDQDGQPWIIEDEEIGVWRRVHPTQIDAPEGWFSAGRLYRGRYTRRADYRVMQLVLRDEASRYPWDPGYDETLRWRQPALYQPARDYGDPPPPARDLAALRLADARGWSIVPVPGPQSGFAYTVGLADHQGAELIAFMPTATLAADLLQAARWTIAEGGFVLEDGAAWDLEGMPTMRWRKVHESQYLAWNLFLLNKFRRRVMTGRRDAVDAYQLFLPDLSGRFPWEPGSKGANRQPSLFRPVDPRDVRRGRLPGMPRW